MAVYVYVENKTKVQKNCQRDDDIMTEHAGQINKKNNNDNDIDYDNCQRYDDNDETCRLQGKWIIE